MFARRQSNIIRKHLGIGIIELIYFGQSDDGLREGVTPLEEFSKIIIDQVILEHTNYLHLLVVHNIINNFDIVEVKRGGILLLKVPVDQP